jgi:glutamate carboxypeptidase
VQRLLEFCEARRDWLLETIEALVTTESPSTDKTAVDRCGRELAARLEFLGAAVERLPQREAGDHIRAVWPGAGPQVLLLGHFDTVWEVGQLARMPIRQDGGRLYGPGVFDMKAGIGIAMLAVRALLEAGEAPAPAVVMLWTTDEEVGSGTSRAAIEGEAARSAAVLVLEPALPGGTVKTRRKGCGEFRLRVRGVSAHAGIDPGAGASAIHELARQIAALEVLQDLEAGVSINAGVIGGGTRPNVVAEEAWAQVDVRVPTRQDGDRLTAALQALRPLTPRTSLDVSGGFGRPPLERTPGVARLYEQARAVATAMGRRLEEGGTGGGSDGSFTAALGVPTLDGLGAVGEGAHAAHEHVVIDDLCWRAALVAGLMGRIRTG